MHNHRFAFLAAIGAAVLLVCSSSSYAQTDTTTHTDKVHLRNGTIMEGKVTIVKTDIVEFVEKETGLTYELKKSEIRVILLASGKSISFAEEPPKQAPVQVSQPVLVEKESGASAGLIVLASVGAILIILLLLGAASSSS